MLYKDINEAIHNKDYSVVKTFKAGGFASRFLFHPQKSLLFPPVRYFNTSTTSAMKIMIPKNMVWSSCIYYYLVFVGVWWLFAHFLSLKKFAQYGFSLSKISFSSAESFQG